MSLQVAMIEWQVRNDFPADWTVGGSEGWFRAKVGGEAGHVWIRKRLLPLQGIRHALIRGHISSQWYGVPPLQDFEAGAPDWVRLDHDGRPLSLGLYESREQMAYGWPFVAAVHDYPPNRYLELIDYEAHFNEWHTWDPSPDQRGAFGLGFFDGGSLMRAYPNRVYWPGAIINTAAYSVVLFAAIVGTWLGVRSLVRALVSRSPWFRRRRGLCPACAYPITGTGTCPECGTAT